jgi:hypothetical protein
MNKGRRMPDEPHCQPPTASCTPAISNRQLATGNRQPVTSGGEERLREALRRYRSLRARRPEVDGVDQAPGCVYGLVTRDLVDDVWGDLEDIKAEIAWIRRVIVAAIVSAAVGTVLRLAGLL